MSARVQEDARGKLDLAFEDLGEQRPKNIAWPVRVFYLRGAGNAAGAAEGQLLRLYELLPGLRSDDLAGLFDFFPLPLRQKVMAALSEAGLVPTTAL